MRAEPRDEHDGAGPGGAGPELGPLPSGHHGLTREQVIESQQERLLAGISQAVAEHGYGGTTITHIVKAASVSSRAFYENFESKEACFIAALDAVVAHLKEVIEEAWADEPDWPHQAVAGLRAGLAFFDDNPDLARLVLVEPVSSTPAIAAHFQEIMKSFVPYLLPGRAERPEGETLPESTEDSLLGGLLMLTSRLVILHRDKPLEALLPDLVEFGLAPYVGAERAKELALEAGSRGA